MTVYFRSAELMITEQAISVRDPRGWQVWTIADLQDFRVCHLAAAADRRSWCLGGPALVLVLAAGPLGGWFLPGGALLFATACAWYVADCRSARRRASAQLWATNWGTSVLVFELPKGDFDAACRALRRVFERLGSGDR